MVRRELSYEDSIRIATLRDQGKSFREIGRILGRDHKVVSRAYHRYEETHSHRRRPGQGRPRCTTPREDRAIVHAALQDRRVTAPQLAANHYAATHQRTCQQTVRNILRRARLSSRRPVRGPALSRQHRRNRLAYAQAHRRWNRRRWGRVLFSDECRFKLYRCDGRVRVWRRRNERYNQDCVQEKAPFFGGSVMMWAGITRSRRTPLVHIPPPGMNAQRYVVEVVEAHIVPFVKEEEKNLRSAGQRTAPRRPGHPGLLPRDGH